MPVTENGHPNGKLLGLVTRRDVDFIEDRSTPVSSYMTPVSNLVLVVDPCSLQHANDTICRHKISTLPVVNGTTGHLVSIVTRDDLRKNRDFPHALKRDKRLVVGAAVDTADDDKLERVRALVTAGVDVVVLDARQGDSSIQIAFVKCLKATFPTLEIVGGNVVTSAQLVRLIKAGVDAVRVGMGTGSVSTSQNVKAVGRAQLSAIYQTARIARAFGNIPVIAGTS